MTAWPRRRGHVGDRKRVQGLMRHMGLDGAVPGPDTRRPHPSHAVCPYLIVHMEPGFWNLLGVTGITYAPMPAGFLCLVAIIDWYSREKSE